MDNQHIDSHPDESVLADVFDAVAAPYADNPELYAAIQRDIVMAASGQSEWEKDNHMREAAASEELIERTAWGMLLRFRCSDSREEDAVDAARGSGVARSFRIPGGFLIDPDGELSDVVGVLLEQAGKDGNKSVEIEQHSSCGAMKIIYTYHTMKKGVNGAHEDGPDYILGHYGPAFAAMAKRRANLFAEVAKRVGPEPHDFSFYKDMGFPLTNPDAAVNFQACMALQQGLWDYEKVMEEHKTVEGIPEPLFLYRHISEGGWVHTMDPKTKKLVGLPHPDAPDYKEALASLLERFDNQEMKDSLVVASIGMKSWMEENQLKMYTANNDMGDAQAPELSCVRSCDPRAEDAYHVAKGAGRMLSLRIVGPFMTEAGGDLDHQAGQFIELCGAYGVKTMPVEMLNDSETMKVIYTYNKDAEGAAFVEKNYKKRFVRLARRRAGLYNEVLKKVMTKDGSYDFSVYEKLGVPLYGDENQKFQTCMTMQQGLSNLKAAQERRAAHPKLKLPLPMLFLKDVYASGKTFVMTQSGTFKGLPHMVDVSLDEKPTPPAKASVKLAMHRTCACGSC